ncbi:hypothetical protein ACFLUP_03385, partial [Chloroflexota bacterium]
TIRTVSDGTFVEKYFDVPQKLRDGDDDETVRGGEYYVYLTLENDETVKARVEFDFSPSISLDSARGAVADQIQITGEGFADNEDFEIDYDGSSLSIASGSQDTDGDGKFVCTVQIPESPAGEHTITVTGDDSIVDADDDFTVEPALTASPASGPAGTPITVSGTGYKASTDVAITFGGDAAATVATDDNGSFSTSFNALPKADGSQTIVADDGVNSEEVNFTIATATLIINPTSGDKDTVISMTGSSFLASKTISIIFNNININDPITTSDASGSFNTQFPVPIPTVGTYIVTVSDGTNIIESDFEVVINVTSQISPTTSAASPGNIGTKLTVSGSGFTAGGTVTIKYDDATVASTTVGPEPDRNFSAAFTVPLSSSGEHTVIASDGTNTKAFTFSMETTPPAIPPPLKPEMNLKAKAETYFDWEDVTDPSLPVTYTLQIATNADFASPLILDMAGLKQSEYTIIREMRLPSVSKEAPYYWRVKATDGAGNESEWTGNGAFYVGTSLSISQPIIYTLIAIGALVLAGFAFWMGRKTAYY